MRTLSSHTVVTPARPAICLGLLGVFPLTLDVGSGFHAGEGRILIEYSLWLLFRALLPVLVWHLTRDESFSYRFSSGAAAVASVTYYLVRGREPAEQQNKHDASPYLFYGLLGADLADCVALTANATGLLPWHPSVIYLLSIAYLVLGTTMSFLRFASPLWTDNTAK